ncbi:MAG: WecB/TagA/CpsF family glycosyltransferase [Candidatus Kapaibacterium sp.]
MNKTAFNGIVYNSGRQDEFVDYLINEFKEGSDRKIIVHLNLSNYYYMGTNKELYEFIKSKCIAVLEGIGMKTAFYLKGFGKLNDLNGTDSVPEFLKQNRNSNGIFLLGAKNSTVASAARNIKSNYPHIDVKGYHTGYFSIEDEKNIIDTIINSGTKILFFGRGFPLEADFIMRNYDRLKNLYIWNLGGLFDFLSGEKKRAPKFIRLLRLEWLYRMQKEPLRMLFRNTVAAYWSFYNILTGKG